MIPLPPPETLPLRAMTRGLAEMQTSIMAAALPMFEGRVDHFMVYTLLARRSVDSERPTPVLSVANSLRIPFETTRRHVATLVDRGLCRRDTRGVIVKGSVDLEPLATLAPLAHDCLVRFVADLAAIDILPSFAPSGRRYSWQSGWRAAADLMLAVADGNRDTHHDRVDLVLFSTILCANKRPVTTDPVLSRRYVTIAPSPPAGLARPIRARALSEVLCIPQATVRRRLERLCAGPVDCTPDGLVIAEEWLASPEAISTSATTWGNVRRLLTGLATQGFPFDAPETAYRIGRPPLVQFG